MRSIITHTSPDLDAICSVWLLKRYGGLEDYPVEFVNTGKLPEDRIADAIAVVDTGGVYDPDRLRFDHHQLPGDSSNETCAALQVAANISILHPERLEHLSSLLNLVYAVDTGRAESGSVTSIKIGLHAILKGHQKRKETTDKSLMEFGFILLDDIARSLRGSHMAQKLLQTHTKWVSSDGLIWAIENAPEEASSIAFENGAHIVLFTSTSPMGNGEKTYAIGAWRRPGVNEPHCGNLIEKVSQAELDEWLTREINTWFKHPAGFFTGRGTLKAPCSDPILVTVKDVAKAIDQVWER